MGDFEKEVRVNTFAAGDVRELEMRIATASVWTKESADGEIRVEAKNLQTDRYTCELRAGKLVIDYRLERVVNWPQFGSDATEITVSLPAGLTLERAVLDVGAGSMNLNAVPVTCGQMKAEIGAGKWKAAHLSVPDSLHVEIGAGEAKMEDVTAGSLDIECGVGSCRYKGSVNGDIRVNCGVGNCSFCLDNQESDFNYDVSCAVGSVRINDNRLKSFAAKKSFRNHSALGTAVLECGLGSIELRTAAQTAAGT